MKNFFKKEKSVQIISLNECLYLALETDFKSEEELFNEAYKHLELENSFDYAFSYLRQGAKTHIFLSEFIKLDTSKQISICELVLWRNLSKIDKNLNSFCVFLMNENSSFLAFFDKENLLFAKNISKHLMPLNDDFSELLEFLNFKELAHKFKCKDYIISENLTPLFKKLDLNYHLKSAFEKNLKNKLLSLELLRKEKSVNFLRTFKRTMSFKSFLILSFIASFLLVFCFKITLLYEELESKILLENEDQKRLNLSKIEEKNSLNEEKISSQNALINELKSFHNEDKLVQSLGRIFDIFYQSKVQISSLEYENELFKIYTKELNDKLLNAIYSNDFFLLKEKKQENNQFILFLKAR